MIMPVIKPKVTDLRTMMYEYFWDRKPCSKDTLHREVSSHLIFIAEKVYHYIECKQGKSGYEYHLSTNGEKYFNSKVNKE